MIDEINGFMQKGGLQSQLKPYRPHIIWCFGGKKGKLGQIVNMIFFGRKAEGFITYWNLMYNQTDISIILLIKQTQIAKLALMAAHYIMHVFLFFIYQIILSTFTLGDTFFR